MNPSVVRIMCPNLRCRKVLAVPASTRGKTVRCRSCATTIRVPKVPGALAEGARGAVASDESKC